MLNELHYIHLLAQLFIDRKFAFMREALVHAGMMASLCGYVKPLASPPYVCLLYTSDAADE